MSYSKWLKSAVFSQFHFYFPFKRAELFIWTILNPLHLRMLYAKFGWNWPHGSFKFVNVFSHFRNDLALEKGRALHLNKLESPSPKDALCQVWLKLVQWLWKRRSFKFVNVFLQFGKGQSPSFELTWSKDSLHQVLLKLSQWFWRRRFF